MSLIYSLDVVGLTKLFLLFVGLIQNCKSNPKFVWNAKIIILSKVISHPGNMITKAES